MYFDFEDYHPDIPRVGPALTRLEVVLLSIIFHLLTILAIVLLPRYFPELFTPRVVQLAQSQSSDEPAQFVFVQPRNDLKALKPPDLGEASDQDRIARAPERAPNPTNPLPYMRGNTPERVERMPDPAPRGQGPEPDSRSSDVQPDHAAPAKFADSSSSLELPDSLRGAPPSGAAGRAASAGGQLGDALRNLQRYVQRDGFDNPQGGGQFGPEIQFDTKGVEFGPWIRRFVAQVKRNWLIPYAAMSMKGHVVVTFNVHKDGSLTDLTVVGPCDIDAFNNAAFGALASSNPTQPLPPEYPADKAFFTVTFFYNESPR